MSAKFYGYTFPAPAYCFCCHLQWFCVPFVLMNPATSNITEAAVTKVYQEPWIGKLEPEEIGPWIDELLLLVKKGGGNQTMFNSLVTGNLSKI